MCAIKCCFHLAVFFSASTLLAQLPPAPPPTGPTGQVTGHVICGDTDGPARFASVQLIPEKPEQIGIPDVSTLQKSADFTKALTVVMGSLMKGSGLSTLAAIDGSFTLAKVPPGTYYVVAQLPGYLSPLNQLSQQERLAASADAMKAVQQAAQKITIEANHSAQIDVRLERGGSLSGTVQYDDGAPASGVVPTLLVLQPDGKWKPLSLSLQPVPTDDRGRFRLSGLPAGKYAIQAALPTVQASAGVGMASVSMHMNMGDALVVYSGGALREKDIKPVEVGNGDEVSGIDVVFPLSGLHTLSGTATAKFDNHPLNHGSVLLIDPDTRATLRTVLLDADGAFRLNYVPEGAYILKLAGAADAEAREGSEQMESDFARLLSSKVVKAYGDVEQKLTVNADMPSITLQAPEPARTATPGHPPA